MWELRELQNWCRGMQYKKVAGEFTPARFRKHCFDFAHFQFALHQLFTHHEAGPAIYSIKW